MAKKKKKKPLMRQRYMGLEVSVTVVKLNKGWNTELAERNMPKGLRKAISSCILDASTTMIRVERNTDCRDTAPSFTLTFKMEGTFASRTDDGND